METLKRVQAITIDILSKDPDLEKEENKCLKQLVNSKFEGRIEI